MLLVTQSGMTACIKKSAHQRVRDSLFNRFTTQLSAIATAHRASIRSKIRILMCFSAPKGEQYVRILTKVRTVTFNQQRKEGLAIIGSMICYTHLIDSRGIHCE